ncbi:MAG: T9SS type A sorting domain-containing protein [Lutibacter sp.]|nr:T9SS type A sorting domain-containing protein [Lutibacter sp.]
MGKPNNGTIELTVAKDYDYLVGNPYPSALDADQFLIDNNPSGTASITGTIYFWEHYGGDTHNLAGYQGGYATYSLGSGVPASSFPGLGGGTSVKGAPGQYIPVAQAFFVVGDAVDGGQIQFNNGQRVFVKEGTTSIFMKTSNTKSKTENTRGADLRPKFRIGFDAPKISHRQLLFTIDERATQAVDWGFDAEIYEIFADDMYWMLNNKKYVIQATNSLGLNSEVPLGIQLSKTGMVTVKIDALENVDDDTSIYLKDKLTGESFNMRNKPVQLNLTAGKYADRFVLVFKTQKLVAEDVKTELLIPATSQPIIEGIHVFMNNALGELQIKNNSSEEITSVALINAVGQTVKSWNSNFNIRTISLPLSTATGVYLVLITTKTGKTVKKISVK